MLGCIVPDDLWLGPRSHINPARETFLFGPGMKRAGSFWPTNLVGKVCQTPERSLTSLGLLIKKKGIEWLLVYFGTLLVFLLKLSLLAKNSSVNYKTTYRFLK